MHETEKSNISTPPSKAPDTMLSKKLCGVLKNDCDLEKMREERLKKYTD